MSFDAALAFVLRWEGGYSDHPADPGGATNKGITQRTYDAWRIRRGQTRRDVRQITDAEMRAIYEVDYWLAAHCDRLPAPLDLVQFDTAVNMGVGRAIRFLQWVALVQQDGDFGPATQRAVRGLDMQVALPSYCDRREWHYRSLVQADPLLAVFIKGWLNRLNALRKEAGVEVPA